jgi:acyl-CoA thioesterase I
MTNKLFFSLFSSVLFIFFGCNKDNQPEENLARNVKFLTLGDSYTKGQGVCNTCNFPYQLKDSLQKYLQPNDLLNYNSVAQTGWTTTNLISNINNNTSLDNKYNLVTLLIGVNNQYQGLPFNTYETEFPQLVNTAISQAKGISNNVIVISIPDYAYTPFGQSTSNPTQISTDIDNYNHFAKQYCLQNNITFVDITDITRNGLTQTNLVAQDNLHPSEIAYTKFIERILPFAKAKLGL